MELGGIDRLAQIVVHAGGQTLLPHAAHGVGSHRDNRQCGIAVVATDQGGGFIAPHDRHLDIHEHQIIVRAEYGGHRLLAIGRKVGNQPHVLSSSAATC